jgi:hypothetical protein
VSCAVAQDQWFVKSIKTGTLAMASRLIVPSGGRRLSNMRMRISIVSCMLLALAGGAQAQAPNWCLKWNDGCKTCERKSVSDETQCSQPTSGCATRLVRCERADKDALQRSCEKTEFRDTCNVCSVNPVSGSRRCTLKGCPPGETWIVCVRSRR